MNDTQSLFEAIDIKRAFKNIKYGTVDYSRRAAERRSGARVHGTVNVLVHLDDADHPIATRDISLSGMRLDRKLPLACGEKVALTLEGIGDFDCQVVTLGETSTHLKILRSSDERENLKTWLAANRTAPSARH